MSIVNEFFKTEHGKGLLKRASLEKKALDKDQYYDKSLQGPTQDEVKVAHPQGGTTTQVSVGGKGGEGVYEVKKTDIKASDPSANAHVETITEIHDVVEDVARKEATGKQGAVKTKGLAKAAEEKKEEEKAEEKKEEEKKEVEAAAKKKNKKKKLKMRKKCQLEKLMVLADKLDAAGMPEEASMIDQIIKEETEITE
jgi:hypothetical protein